MALLDLQSHPTGSPSATAFDLEAVADPAPTTAASEALGQARTADRLWREQRHPQLEKQLAQGQWLHYHVIRPFVYPSLTFGPIILGRFWLPLVLSPGGFGVDLASDWGLVQWCTRYVIFLCLLLVLPAFVRRWVSQEFTRWEIRLRTELGRADGD